MIATRMLNRGASPCVSRVCYSTGVSKRLPLERIVTPEQLEEIHSAKKSAKLWGGMWLFGCLPLTIGLGYIAMKRYSEELHHAKKRYEQEGPLEFYPAPYMRKRTAQFPWGDNTWFENPYFNAKPRGDE